MRVLLIAYDNNSQFHWFPLGLGYISTVFENEGYNVDVYSQDMNHWPEEHLTSFLDRNRYDMVGIGMIAGYYPYRKMLKICEAINKSKQRPTIMLGGHMVTPEPEYFIRKTKADIIVMGEGERAIKNIKEGCSFSDIKGIAFRQGDKVVINEREELIEDLDSIEFPAYHLFPINYYRMIRMPESTAKDFVMPMMSGRGCPFNCTFCYQMDGGFRKRSDENIIEEIKMLQKDYGITYIYFADDLLMSSRARTTKLCESILSHKLEIKWACNGRLNFAKPKVLNIMKKAGCKFINYGIESMDNFVLSQMNKNLNVRVITNGVENTLREGISPGLNMLFGNVGDNRETLQKAVDFLLRYDNQAQIRTIRPVTPYPGCELYYRAIREGKLDGVEDFYERKHVNSDLITVNFTNLSDEEYYECLLGANRALLGNYYKKVCNSNEKELNELYSAKNANFRGFRHV